MVFPGVLRGRPEPRLATILANRPRRSLSSPRMLARLKSSGARQRRAGTGRQQQKSDAGPGRFEDPSTRPEVSLRGWHGLTPHGLALCGSVPRRRQRNSVCSPSARPAAARPRTLREKRFLGCAYRCCHNEPMDSGETYLPSKPKTKNPKTAHLQAKKVETVGIEPTSTIA